MAAGQEPRTLRSRSELNGAVTGFLLNHSTNSRPNNGTRFWLAGGRDLKVEVAEGDLDDLLRRGDESVQYAVDAGRVDVRVVRRREHALPSLVSAVLITDAGPVTAADSTSPAEHDTFARYTRTDGRIYTRRIIFTASLRQLRSIRSTEYRCWCLIIYANVLYW